MKTEENVSFDKILTQSFLIESLKTNLGFTAPTAIQVAVAPAVLEGRNLFAGAKTGSGKTIAFLAPLAERLLKKEIKKAIVLAPTRELVLQIDEEAAKLLAGQNDVVPIPLYGGVPIDPQILAIRHHRPSLFIATPGRVLDLVQEGMLPLLEIELCVLDEADRMCDMGFAPQVTQILELLSELKQTLLFSATLPKELSDMMNRFCPDPVRIQIDASDKSSETIRHEAIICNRREKIHRLADLIKPENVTALVFTRTRNGADALHRSLSREIKDVGILHAGFSMGDRERTIRAYREGQIRVLIATDVVSRGIDVDRITHVVHFDIPDSLEDYIHRSGRSGRAGRAGHTIAFFERDNRDQMERFKELKKKIQFDTLPGSADPEKTPSVNMNESHGNPDRARNRDRTHGPRPKGRGPRHHEKTSQGHERQHGPQSQNRGPKRHHDKPHRKIEAKPNTGGLLSKTKNFLKKIFSKSV